MKTIDLNWEDFKSNVDSRSLKVQYYLKSDLYHIMAFDGQICFEHIMEKKQTPDADQTDFETNYMPIANGTLESKSIDGKVVLHQDAFADNVLPDGKVLYLKIHGMKAVIPAGQTHEFKMTIPYAEAYLQGAEIFVDILAQTDMTVKHPVYGVIEQYGYDVCMGKVIYKREAKYAAKLPMGLEVSAECTNVETTDQEMGVNFILHEIRDDS